MRYGNSCCVGGYTPVYDTNLANDENRAILSSWNVKGTALSTLINQQECHHTNVYKSSSGNCGSKCRPIPDQSSKTGGSGISAHSTHSHRVSSFYYAEKRPKCLTNYQATQNECIPFYKPINIPISRTIPLLNEPQHQITKVLPSKEKGDRIEHEK